MEKVEIKRVRLSEVEQLQQIGKQTFAETFSPGNSEENMKKYLEKGFSTEKLKAELADKDSEFYFAILANKIVGYLKVNFGYSQTELKDQNALEIERIYILKEYHGKKVRQQLYEKAIEISRQRPVDYVWLGAWEENPGAISFYRKNGFVAFDKHIFTLGNEAQTDIMMKLQLK